MHLILPKTLPFLENLRHLPMFFLAGPILGGGDWHREMSFLLRERAGECIVVNPSRYETNHPDYPRRMLSEREFSGRQTGWERHFLQQAGDEWPMGCIIFWLGCESKMHQRNDGFPYAMDTRGEIAEWRGRMMYAQNLRVAVGAEEDFPGLSQIVENFELALGSSFRIYRTMEEVVDRAIFLTQPQFSFAARVSA